MATLLDAPRPGPNVEAFVEKQLIAARRRVRFLDFFLAGLTLGIGSLVVLLAGLLVDRAVEMPRGTWWGIVTGYLALAAGFLYWALFRPSRRAINPYFAARQVERNVPDAKNSLVTFVDFEEDPKLPGSIKTAISQKAARDLKKVDLNRAIENRTIIWLGIAAGVLLLANLVVAFLPPTRTELTLEQPPDGDITVFNNQPVTFEVRVHGRVPEPNAPDAVRLRMWYNPDDPENYEDRPLQPAEGDRRQFSITVPPKQVRNGFHYRILAGNTQTPEYTVTCKIIPEFTGFDVAYEYPGYLKRLPEQSPDPNLIAPYGTVATLTASTNRDVKHGHIEIEGDARRIEGQLIEGQPDAIRFTVPMVKEGFYRIWFTTPEGDRNQDPARLRLTVIDPKPAVRTFDIGYDYPAYLRFRPMTAVDVSQPEIEAPRGTQVVLTAKTTRGVKDAKLEVPGQPAVAGELIPDEPTWVRFKLPPLDQDGAARLTFTPTTGEPASEPRSIPVRALADQAPTVRLDVPKDDEVSIPANGTLDLKGMATDDHGVDRITLRMKVAGTDRDVQPKPYRKGMSFLRAKDNSWPTQVEYKDFVKLAELRLEREPNWRITPGTEIEYWLEAVDNCTIKPGPNRGESAHKKFRVVAPVVKPAEQQKLQQQNQKRADEQQKHEKRQDEKNQTERRDVQQPPPKGADQAQPENAGQQGNPQDGNPQQGQPQQGGQPDPKAGPNGQPQDMNPDGTPDPDKAAQDKQVEQALKQAAQDKAAGGEKSGPNKPEDKVDPGAGRAQGPGPMDEPPAADRKPQADPNQDMTGDGTAGGARSGKIDNTKDQKAEEKDAGAPQDGMPPEEKGGDKQSFGGGSTTAGQSKPEPKDGGRAGTEPEGGDQKAEARPAGKSSDPTNPKGGESVSKGTGKPETDVTRSDGKKPSDEPGPMGDKPPADAAAQKPKEAPDPAGTKPEPKTDQVTDQGGARGGPQDDGAASEQRPSKEPMGGTGSKDDIARGGSKGGPGSPPPGGQQNKPGELDREPGELAREINSPNPEVSDKAKEDVDRLMRNPKTREQTRQDLDSLEKNARDALSRKKAQQLRRHGEQAAKNYDAEKPTEDNMNRLSKKLKSEDRQERQDAEQRLKDWKNNPETRDELKKQTDELSKKDPAAGERVKNALNQDQQTGNPGDQKLDEKDLQQMAKDLNGSDPQKKADAQKRLDQMMQDPKTRQQAQDKLNEMARNAQGQEKQDLENAAQQAREKAGQMAGQQPQPKVNPDDLKKAADKLANGTEQEKQAAREQLDKLAKDPKAAAEAQKQLREMANNAKTPEDKKALEDAAKRAGELAKNDPAKPDPKALADAARKLNSADPKEKEQARQQLQDMMNDPQKAEQAKRMLEDMAKNAETPEDKQALQDAAKQAGQMAKDMGPKDRPQPKPEDLKDLADQMAGKDPKAKDEARQKFDEMMKDPKTREQAMKQLEEMAKNAKPEDKQALQDALKHAAETAKNQPKPTAEDLKNLQEMAKKLDRMDPEAKENFRKQMDEALKDPKTREALEKAAKEMAQKPKSPEEQKQFNELMKQLGGGFPDIAGKPIEADPRNKLKSAELLLEKFKKNVTNEEFKERLGWTQEQIDAWMTDQEAAIAALRKQAEQGDWRTDRTGRAANAGGPASIKLEPKDGGNLSRGGRYAPPPGYVDPYKKFTTEQAGGAKEPKR